jgi:phenylalanyl-tRNA synthetase alpha chain
VTVDQIRADFQSALAAAGSLDDLQKIRDRFAGRKGGVITAFMKAVGAAPPDERRALGAQANALKTEFEAAWTARMDAVSASAPPPGAIDVTLPARHPLTGRLHPLTIVRERVEDIFLGMGYEVVDGPELEDDWHNFEALNIPAEHPARDMQDTLYLSHPVPSAGGGRPATLLRTHTSGMQIRYMESYAPPVRIIAPGRVYRRDNFDATHTPMFAQVEGLVVDEGITLGDLKGTLNAFARRFFHDGRGPLHPGIDGRGPLHPGIDGRGPLHPGIDADVRTRFRPSFFPYTEPSAELDVECMVCHGKGCPVCKQSGWIEVLGCGMVHPAVFEAVHYDAEKYTGFAFGVGIERLALLLYGIDDIRMFYENDLRFLEQVPL